MREDVALAQMPQHAPSQQRVVRPSFAFDCGPSGAAVQNLNIALGLEEGAGL